MIEDPPEGLSHDAWRLVQLRLMPDERGFYLYWLGQSGYAIRAYEAMALVDLYLSDSLTKKYARTEKPHVRMYPIWISPEMLSNALVHVVASTHQHTDHLDPDTLRPMMDLWRRPEMAPPYTAGILRPLIAPEACRRLAAERAGIEPATVVGMDDGSTATISAFEFTAVPAAHPTLERDAAGHLTCLGYVIRVGDFKIYHSGDTVVYDGMAEKVRALGPVDVAILPINGKVGNMGGRDAANLAKAIGARVVIPCHYDMFEFNTADPYAEFVPECERIGQPYRVLKLGERFCSSEIP